jgi:hypothetical protein
MPAIMTPSLIDELEDALASKTEERRMVALWRITDLFIVAPTPIRKTTSRRSMTHPAPRRHDREERPRQARAGSRDCPMRRPA